MQPPRHPNAAHVSRDAPVAGESPWRSDRAPRETQLTSAHHGHILTNTAVWSHDGQWIAYDVRSDPAGAKFNGKRIERVHVNTGEVQVLYQSASAACCGVVTCSPTDDRVVFIQGPQHPTEDWQYGPSHRRGVIVDSQTPGQKINLDARDLTPPFTPGALRGGSHVHVFSGDGLWVSFTYEDHVLTKRERQAGGPSPGGDRNQRNIGVAVPGRPVTVPHTHPRNHDGEFFSVLVTRTVNEPRPGSDEISRAEGDAWVGAAGYVRSDGTRQRRAIAFLGDVIAPSGESISEVFIVDIPDDVTIAGPAPLEGTPSRRPAPPAGVVQRRLTYTADRRHSGIQGPRHWVRSSPDGERIAFLMRDDAARVQLWTISPNGGSPTQVTDHPFDVASAFSWRPDGARLAYIADGSVWVVDGNARRARRLTPCRDEVEAPRPEACVFSPDGNRIAYVRPVAHDNAVYNQIFVLDFTESFSPEGRG